MLYDWPKAEPPDMELAKTFDDMFDRFKILGFSAKYDDTQGYPTTMVECNDGSPRSTMGGSMATRSTAHRRLPTLGRSWSGT